MISKRAQYKGIFSKLVEKYIKILLKKECNKIGKLKIDITASNIQIIRGIIAKINIIGREINYKNLLLDKIELEANDIRVIYDIISKELKFNDDFNISFEISFSENSLKTILMSNDWSWIGDLIAKELANEDKLKDIKIINDQIMIKHVKDFNSIDKYENVEIMAKNGKIYLKNKNYNKSIEIPIEDKVYIKKVDIINDSIIIFANSSISY